MEIMLGIFFILMGIWCLVAMYMFRESLWPIFFIPLTVVFFGAVLSFDGKFTKENVIEGDYSKLYNVYTAWEDKKIDKGEIREFFEFEERLQDVDVLNVLNDFTSDSDNAEFKESYEELVNEIMNVSLVNKSEKTAFKRYVVSQNVNVMIGAWDDKKFDRNELRLFELASDVSGKDYTGVANQFEKRSDDETAKELYNEVIKDIEKDFVTVDEDTKSKKNSETIFELND